MKLKSAFGIVGSVFLFSFGLGEAAAQLLPGEREVEVAAIPGVISAGTQWDIAWAGLDNADGIVASPDGGVLIAQEQVNRVRKIGPDGGTSIYIGPQTDDPTHVANTHGAGSLSGDTARRLLAVQRTCTDSFNPRVAAACAEPTKIGILLPEPRTLADQFPDGRSIGRPNDLVADSKGGAYFTSRPKSSNESFPPSGVYYTDRNGIVTLLDDAIGPNGIMLSPDEQTLYVTNGSTIVAYEVRDDGSVGNRRDFGTLDAGGRGDGMAVDAAGRLYITTNPGVQVFGPGGDHLGLIPTHRPPISLTFSGPGKRTLFVDTHGAVGPDGKAYEVPAGQRNMGMTLYKIAVLAEGFQGRAK